MFTEHIKLDKKVYDVLHANKKYRKKFIQSVHKLTQQVYQVIYTILNGHGNDTRCPALAKYLERLEYFLDKWSDSFSKVKPPAWGIKCHFYDGFVMEGKTALLLDQIAKKKEGVSYAPEHSNSWREHFLINDESGNAVQYCLLDGKM